MAYAIFVWGDVSFNIHNAEMPSRFSTTQIYGNQHDVDAKIMIKFWRSRNPERQGVKGQYFDIYES